jgi:DNA-binding transcriptional ArsR family regulator
MDLILKVERVGGSVERARASAREWTPRLKALADETRLTIALLLVDGPKTVKELQEATGLGQTLVSHHLGPLREQGLVSAAPRGRSNVYALCCEELAGVVRGLASIAAATPEGAEACAEGCCEPAHEAQARPDGGANVSAADAGG